MCALPILASGATLTLNADGSYVYNGDTITGIENQPFGTPVPDSFTYTVTDGHGDTNTGARHITRLDPAQQIVSPAASVLTNEDTILHHILPTCTSGSDAPSTLQAVVSGQPITFGTFFFNDTATTEIYTSFPTRRSSDLTITGIENQPFGTPVPDSFTYTVTDGHGDTNTGTVHITVNVPADRKSTRLNSSHQIISYAVFCFKTNFTSGSDDPPTLQPGVSGPHH